MSVKCNSIADQLSERMVEEQVRETLFSIILIYQPPQGASCIERATSFKQLVVTV